MVTICHFVQFNSPAIGDLSGLFSKKTKSSLRQELYWGTIWKSCVWPSITILCILGDKFVVIAIIILKVLSKSIFGWVVHTICIRIRWTFKLTKFVVLKGESDTYYMYHIPNIQVKLSWEIVRRSGRFNSLQSSWMKKEQPVCGSRRAGLPEAVACNIIISV